jgi:hypothetical protein
MQRLVFLAKQLGDLSPTEPNKPYPASVRKALSRTMKALVNNRASPWLFQTPLWLQALTRTPEL